MQIEVTNCRDCPFCNISDMGIGCNHPNNELDYDVDMPSYDEKWIPVECPLLKSPVVVQVSKDISFKK